MSCIGATESSESEEYFNEFEDLEHMRRLLSSCLSELENMIQPTSEYTVKYKGRQQH
jgi:hypothetical protein